jgi:cytochrome c-type biogenesis protein CcmF
MKFEGEHLLPGQLGHFFVLLAFTASLLSTLAYFISLRTNTIEKHSWLRYARIAFIVQLVSLLAVFGTIYFICSHHYFEYFYAYKHASKELESKYLLACIWEGQEGSFLLWSLWHCVLGCVIIFRGKEWEAPVMTVISVAQVFLTLMLLGIYVSADVRLGSNPFVLTRNEINGPIFSRPEYLSFIKDGVGLNVLLRNYWMVIHPPILFLGFASTIVPVGFAYGGLIKKKWGEWIKPAIPYALFSACVLGTGIMMGGKWAYESLSFGGYWAWDPVENASLVPWLILVAGLHCMVIYNATKSALKTSFIFIILANAFVLYSTFLTRTGVLGDTSVHAFTEAGMAMNILIGMFALAIPLPMIILLLVNVNKMPKVQKEEDLSARDFWMFIGALILFLSSIYIITITSVPVLNKLFHVNIADPQDREFTYNKVMVLVAVIIGVLSAISQFFKYKHTEKQYFIRKISIPIAIALLITILLAIFYPLTYSKQGAGFLGAMYLALFGSLFAFISNLSYIKTVLKGNLRSGGAALAHAGFGLMIAGMLISAGNKQVISDNRKTGLMMPFEKDPTGRMSEDPMENLTLIKNVPTQMAQYTVTYLGDFGSIEKDRRFYSLHAVRKNSSGKVTEDFELIPDAYKMKDNNISSNPSIKHYLTHDVFTYLTSIPNNTNVRDTAQFKVHEVNMGDTIFYSKGYVVLNGITKNPNNEKFHFQPTDTALVADLTVFSKDSTSRISHSNPYLSIKDLQINFNDDTLQTQSLYTRFAGLTKEGKFKIALKESFIPLDFVTLKAYVFPYINLVWAGLILMVAGFLVSLTNRIKAKRMATIVTILVLCSALFYMFFMAGA